MNVLKKMFKYFLLGIKSPYLLIDKYLSKKTKDITIWKYIAITNDNKKEVDYIKTNNPEMIENFLITENKKLINLKTNKIICYLYRNINTKEIKRKELIYFLVQITAYMQVGNNLIDSLSLVIKKCHNKNLSRILRLVRYELMCGNDLAYSLEKQGLTFPKLLISVLKDKSVSDYTHLEEMRDYYKSQYLNEIKINKINFYKIFILPYVLVIFTFVTCYIIPKFYNLYKLFLDEEINFLKVFLNLSRYYHIYIIIIVILICLILLFLIFFNIRKTKVSLQYHLMNIKGINSTIINNEMVTFSKTLSLVIKYNINNLEVLKNITNNDNFQKLFIEVTNGFKRDHAISHILKSNKYFPDKAHQMILTGEKFDSLLLQVNNVSNYYQRQIDKNNKKSMNIIGPILIISSAILFGSIIIILLFQCLMLVK